MASCGFEVDEPGDEAYNLASIAKLATLDTQGGLTNVDGNEGCYLRDRERFG